jgi:chromate transporter
VPLATIAGQWARMGVTGFGGPPAHIVLLRALCVDNRKWLSASEFEDGIAATTLLPGPASTQLAIFCAWKLRGPAGAVLGGVCFIVPGLIIILGLSALFLAGSPPLWVQGAAAGAGAAVPAVALQAAVSLLPASRKRMAEGRAARVRWLAYFAAGAAASAAAGPFVVAVLLACGLAEVVLHLHPGGGPSAGGAAGDLPAGGVLGGLPLLAGRSLIGPALAAGGIGALSWVAIKVGALSFGGGFVIIPLMQHDAVVTYHWMSGAQFLNAVALGQVTPGPVVLTVAVVGYAAAGIGGGLLATLIAFLPSFVFVIAGGRHLGRLRSSARAQAFLSGAGSAAIGAIAGAAIPLGLELSHLWQAALLLLVAAWLLLLRRGIVTALLCSGGLGIIAALAGAPVSH